MLRRPSLTMAALIIASVVFVFFVISPGSAPSIDSISSLSKNSNLNDLPNEGKSTTLDDIKQQVEGVTAKKDSKNTAAKTNKEIVNGKPIMAKMANETIRAELGRAGWKVFHTILAQYPEHPTPEERETLSTYIYLFSRVYPCRECAEHFQEMLKKYPPQTSSREHASQWGCHIHNIVNKRLGKEIFDCSDISDKYACGCADDEEEKSEKPAKTSTKLKDIKIDEKQDRTGG